MKKKEKVFMFGGLILSLLLSPGCALFLVGAGVAGGVAISEDEIEGLMEKKFDRVWTAAREVVIKEGFIKLEDRAHGTMEGEVRKSEVKISVAELTEKTVRLRVKARKVYRVVPDLDLANELYNKILRKL